MFSFSRNYMEWDDSSGRVKILFKLIDRDTIEIGRYFGYTMRPLSLRYAECGIRPQPSPLTQFIQVDVIRYDDADFLLEI